MMGSFANIIYLVLSAVTITNQLKDGKNLQAPHKKWFEDGKGRFKWSFGCSFPNGGLLAVDVAKIKKNESSTCPSLCFEDNGCTHFIYSKGYCYLKNFKFVDASPKAATYNNPGGMCGFIVERPNVVKNWSVGDNGQSRWSTFCNYPNAKFNIWTETKVTFDRSKCGAHCLSVKHCTHFGYTLGGCWFKDMRGVPIVQTIEKMIPLCGFIPKRQDIAKQRTYGTTILSTPRNTSISKLNTTNPGIASKTNNQLQKINSSSPKPKNG